MDIWIGAVQSSLSLSNRPYLGLGQVLEMITAESSLLEASRLYNMRIN